MTVPAQAQQQHVTAGALSRVSTVESGEFKKAYDRFVATSPQGSPFATSWWLDAVAPKRYDILTVYRGQEIVAAWPIVMDHVPLLGTAIRAPALTQRIGIMFEQPRSTQVHKRLADEKDWCGMLASQLPKCWYIRVPFDRAFQFWSPLYWLGYSQTTAYTYVIDGLSDLNGIWTGMRENIRREIRKAERMGVHVETTDDVDELWRVNALTFSRQNLVPQYSIDYLKRIDCACRDRHARRILIARSGTDVHAAAYVVWDKRAAYYLIGGGDPALRTSGASSLLLWKAIQFASTVSASFDFEGSMLEPVDRFFRAFGGQPQAYSVISKIHVPLITNAQRWLARLLRRFAQRLVARPEQRHD